MALVKSTFMKILSGEIDSSTGTVKIDSKKRISTLKQSHYEYEDMKVVDCVIMGHKKLWDIKKLREKESMTCLKCQKMKV